jgi:dTDP-glucose 4,6-dehydratase
MDTVVVTGGAGFIGSNFVHSVLANTGARVVVVDALTYAGHLESLADVAAHPRFTFVKADIADQASVEAVFRDHQPSWVVNFAAESHVDRSIDGPRAFVRTNIVGCFELLEAARSYHLGLSDAARRAFRLLQVSTDEVYGTLGATGLFTESTPYAPRSPYSASKAAADHLVLAYWHTYQLPTLLTNCSNNYGPYQFPEKLIPLTILNAVDGKPLPIYGDGQNIRDWLYVGDHCEGLLRVLQEGRIGEQYNLGGHGERTNVQVVDAICAVLDELRPVRDNPAVSAQGLGRYGELKQFVPDRPGHDRRYGIDAAKIRRELRWEPRHDFDMGIRRTVQWYLENTAWCTAVQASNYDRQRLGLGTDRAA